MIPSAVARVAALLGILAVSEGLFALAAARHAAVTVDVGPSTGAIGSGFTESEERPPLTFRWTRRASALDVPLTTAGGAATISLRAARFLDQPAMVRVFVSGRPAGVFTAAPGGFRIHRLAADVPAGPLRVELLSASAGAEDLGVALDWVRVEGPAWRVAGWRPRALVAAGVLAAMAGGFGVLGAALVGLGLAVLLALAAAFDPFAAAHASGHLVFGAAALPAAVAVALRGVPGRRFVVVIVLAGYVIKGGGVFHPRYFYPDVRNFGRYVEALGEAKGTLAERGRSAQVRTNTAYPRFVAGKPYAFPYSPLFFLPFTTLGNDRARVEEALKHAALAAAALEVVAVFVLARTVGGAGSGIAAALLAAFLPPLFNRLLFAMFATIAGHLLDVAAMAAAAHAARAPTVRAWRATFALTLAALLTYVSSLFNLTAFFAAFAALQRRSAKPLLAIAAVAAVVSVACLYLPFLFVFVGEILPAALGGGGAAVPAAGGAALARIPLFYGLAYPLLTAAGIMLIARRATPAGRHAVLAYAAAFAVLVALRAFGAGLFKDLKEIEFVGPLVALSTGALIEEIGDRGRTGKWAAAMVTIGLIAFGLGRWWEYLTAHTALVGLG
jgi:hypothetical protein